MILSPFTPLFFPSAKADGIESAYIQTFAPTDKILIELIGEKTWYGIASVIGINVLHPFRYNLTFGILPSQLGSGSRHCRCRPDSIK